MGCEVSKLFYLLTEIEIISKQLPGEEISTPCTRLEQLARSCEFHDDNKEIKAQIIQNGISSKLRKKALVDPDIALEKIVKLGKSMKLAETQAEGI